jgi:hypothetical protein
LERDLPPTLDDDRPDAPFERLRDRRSPCLSLTDLDESLDDLTLRSPDDRDLFSDLGGEYVQHRTSRMRNTTVDARPRIKGNENLVAQPPSEDDDDDDDVDDPPPASPP